MSVFYCNRCQNYVDGDYVPCVEDPTGEFWLMCDEHEVRCARCDGTLIIGEEQVDTNSDAVCNSCWDKILN